MERELPLQGIRVIELGHIIAGPTAGLILADLGADVIKVERPDGGDQARHMPGGVSAHFYLFNRNKRGIALDLKSPEAKKALLALVKTADVVLDNYAPGVLERLGFGYEALSDINPRIICLSVKGFLPGPYDHRPSLDELCQMMGGLAFMTGPTGRPLRAGASIVDIGAASYGVLGVMAALWQRERTGRGQKVTAGLFETTAFWVGQWMALAGRTGEPSVPMPERAQSERMGWAIFRLFDTLDGEQLFIGVTSNGHWERLCRVLGMPDLFAMEELDDNVKRVAARDWLLPRIAEEVAKHTRGELQEAFEQAGVPYAPVKRPDELLTDPHLTETGQLLPTPLEGGRTANLPKLPFRSNDYGFTLRRQAPALGEHTREVLDELGYSKAEIAELLRESGVQSSEP